jgi:hypothetical protein
MLIISTEGASSPHPIDKTFALHRLAWEASGRGARDAQPADRALPRRQTPDADMAVQAA